MKRVITIILATALALSMAACGGGDSETSPPVSTETAESTATSEAGAMTKADMLNNSKELDLVDLMQAITDNIVRAEQTYIDNIYTVSGFVSHIERDYIELGIYNRFESYELYQDESPEFWGVVNFIGMITVHIDSDVIATLNKEEKITVVGKITGINGITPTMENAYYVDNTFEITGVVFKYVFVDEGYCVVLSNNGELIQVLLEKSDLEKLGDGYHITVSGQEDNKTYTTISGISIPYTLSNARLLNVEKTETTVTGELTDVSSEEEDGWHCYIEASNGNKYNLNGIEAGERKSFKYGGKTYYGVSSVIISGKSVDVKSNITVSGILSGSDLKEITLVSVN
jgi:hypothetical protein